MLKNNGKKVAVSIACTAFVCAVVLLVAAQHHRVQVEDAPKGDIGTRSLQSLDNAAHEETSQPQEKKGFSAYFTKLTRGRRDVDKPKQSSASAADPPPAEDISASDLFIAVKTTKKFHQSRLNLLLDTWISRNVQQVRTNTVIMWFMFVFFPSCNAMHLVSFLVA